MVFEGFKLEGKGYWWRILGMKIIKAFMVAKMPVSLCQVNVDVFSWYISKGVRGVTQHTSFANIIALYTFAVLPVFQYKGGSQTWCLLRSITGVPGSKPISGGVFAL